MSAKSKAIDSIQDAIGKAIGGLSRLSAIEVLEEIESDCESRRQAMEDDERREATEDDERREATED